jgi:uncharacterized protein (DUF924 family)
MRSEWLQVHREALRLFALPGLEDNLQFEQRHLAILERFGRYPHRNAILGRTSTAQELAFCKSLGQRFNPNRIEHITGRAIAAAADK